MQAIFLILQALFASPIKAINKLFDLLTAQKNELENFASDKADRAKDIAISEAQKTAKVLANQAKSDAILQAKTDAQLLADQAKAQAIADAKIDATDKAKSAKEVAIDAANFYTDKEIAKLKLQAEKGYTPLFWEGILSDSNEEKGRLDAVFPTLLSLDMKNKGFYALNVTGKNQDGSILANSEFFVNIVNTDKSEVPLLVSTNDVLIFENDGNKNIKFIQKFDDRFMEVVQQLENELNNRVGKSEFEQTINDVKAYVDAAINPLLLA